MKNLLYTLAIVFVSNLVLAQTETENYIKNTSYQVKTTNGTHKAGTSTELTPDDKIETVTYFDGLGRPIQSIAKQAGGQKQDIVTPIIYDAFGRQMKDYLPYARAYANPDNALNYETSLVLDTNGHIVPLNDQYLAKYADDLDINLPNPFSEKVLEASPLNRVLQQAAPGKDWAVGSGHTIKFDYQTNAGEVRLFSVSHPNDDTEQTQLVFNGFYNANELYKTITKDENWTSGNNHTIEEFKNKQGQILLKRTYNNNELHDTYYVYDDYGNLTYVLSPEASDDILTFGNQDFRVASQTNNSWVNLVNVDKEFAENYNKDLSDYENKDILNADIENEYGGQGGFTVTTFADSELVILNISFSALDKFELKKGELVSLKEYGSYKDTELGVLKGPDFDYYFSIKNNGIYISGNGKLNVINQTYSSSQKLDYELDYTWPMLTNVNPSFAQQFDSSLRNYANDNNLSPLNVYLNNEFGAQGGLQVLVDDNDNVTFNFNISSTAALSLKEDFTIPLDLQRRLRDRDLGTISGQGYSYNFFIRNNTLFASGNGSFTVFNGNAFSPVPITDGTIEMETVEGLCYIYHYDSRNRLIEKKIPGKDWEHIIYNKLDMPILTQDGKQRNDKMWLFTKYDDFGRVTYTGTYLNNNDRLYIQNLVNNHSIQFENKTASANIMFDSTPVYYTKDTFPHNGEQQILTINYYDDYNFDIPSELGSFQNTYNQTVATNTKTLATGSKVRVLETNQWITSVSYYDDKARPIYLTSYNDYLNSIDKVASHIDFVGKVIETTNTHIKDSNSPITIEDNFTYDHTGRLLTQVQIIGSSEELIVNNHYDELGQLENKNVGGTVANNPEESVGLQTIDYSYNIRGWLKTINNDVNTDNDLFNFEIKYNDPTTGTALFNGNISETYWQTANDNNLRGYDYSYDALNRIKLANYHSNELIGANNANEDYSLMGANGSDGIAYDKNGNIIRLRRMGLQEDNNQIDFIDDLTYNYAPLSNQLLSVGDEASEDGFKNGDSTENDYFYDINGNMTKDRNKGITSISYNHLNLPETINITDANGLFGAITYIYDATGVKLKKIVSTGTTTEYAGNFIYENGTLKFFSQPEGYVEPVNEIDISQGFAYVYQYKDHIGNIRLSYSDSDNNGSVDSSEIIEENNYYPFGL